MLKTNSHGLRVKIRMLIAAVLVLETQLLDPQGNVLQTLTGTVAGCLIPTPACNSFDPVGAGVLRC